LLFVQSTDHEEVNKIIRPNFILRPHDAQVDEEISAVRGQDQDTLAG
jgi:hypothetical protein